MDPFYLLHMLMTAICGRTEDGGRSGKGWLKEGAGPHLRLHLHLISISTPFGGSSFPRFPGFCSNWTAPSCQLLQLRFPFEQNPGLQSPQPARTAIVRMKNEKQVINGKQLTVPALWYDDSVSQSASLPVSPLGWTVRPSDRQGRRLAASIANDEFVIMTC